MLPGYISYYLGTATHQKKAITGGIVCSLGLLLTYSLIGLLASLFSTLISAYISTFELIAGIITLFMGIVLTTKLTPPQIPIPIKAPKQKGFAGLFVYGILYGLATISCSAPIFFAILFYAISSSASEAFLSFIIYALGMGLPLILITIMLDKAKETILKKATEWTPIIQRLAGLILILVGAYLIIYHFI
jgi:cytochrome c biogenesis protein CcdA